MPEPPLRDRTLRMTAFPPQGPPYERWELTDEETGDLITAGAFPPDQAAIDVAIKAYIERRDAADRIAAITREISGG